MDSGQSRPSSPEIPIRSRYRPRPSTNETSTILVEPGTIPPEGSQRATIEQNMAFAALQESRQYKNIVKRADTNV
jgi:hypothetical protein